MARLLTQYKEKIVPMLIEKFKYKNSMQAPKITKIVINIGLGEAKDNPKVIEIANTELGMITGQKPLITKSKKSISNFKLREDQPIGLKVTLRGKRMYDFLDRFSNIVAPRIRDFRGFKAKGDGRGNYSIGLDDQQVFPEVNLDKVKRTQGMNITFVTSAKSNIEGIDLMICWAFHLQTKEHKRWHLTIL